MRSTVDPIESSLFTVKQILDISKSLLSQLESSPDLTANTIKKILVENTISKLVIYIAGPVDFGCGSVLQIQKNIKNTPILYPEDYKIIKKTTHRPREGFISALIGKKV